MSSMALNGSRFNLLPMNVFSNDVGRWMDQRSVGQQSAPTSIWEDEANFYLEFDLPGVQADDIEIKFAEDCLQLSANRTMAEERTYLKQERKFGRIDRQFRLPLRVNSSAISAELVMGVLKVTVPKAAESQVRKIEISTT